MTRENICASQIKRSNATVYRCIIVSSSYHIFFIVKTKFRIFTICITFTAVAYILIIVTFFYFVNYIDHCYIIFPKMIKRNQLTQIYTVFYYHVSANLLSLFVHFHLILFELENEFCWFPQGQYEPNSTGWVGGVVVHPTTEVQVLSRLEFRCLFLLISLFNNNEKPPTSSYVGSLFLIFLNYNMHYTRFNDCLLI